MNLKWSITYHWSRLDYDVSLLHQRTNLARAQLLLQPPVLLSLIISVGTIVFDNSIAHVWVATRRCTIHFPYKLVESPSLFISYFLIPSLAREKYEVLSSSHLCSHLCTLAEPCTSCWVSDMQPSSAERLCRCHHARYPTLCSLLLQSQAADPLPLPVHQES